MAVSYEAYSQSLTSFGSWSALVQHAHPSTDGFPRPMEAESDYTKLVD